MNFLTILNSIIGRSPSEAPDTPTGLALLSVDHHTIIGSFDEVTGAEYYEYKIATSVVAFGSVSWNRVMTGTSFTVYNLMPETEYFAIVRAGNSEGTSDPSSAVSTTTDKQPVIVTAFGDPEYAYNTVILPIMLSEELEAVSLRKSHFNVTQLYGTVAIPYVYLKKTVEKPDADDVVSHQLIFTMPRNHRGAFKVDYIPQIGETQPVSKIIGYDTNPVNPYVNRY